MKNAIVATAATVLVLAVAVEAQAGDFYAYYTKLDYDQPQDIATLVKIPVSAAEVFAGRPEQAPTGTVFPVAGNKTLWKKGVSGTALAFDGYFSKGTLPKAKPISFTLNGSKDSPVCNPCFVLSNWDSDAAAAVTVNGSQVKAGKAFRQGMVRDTAGKRQMIIWLELESDRPVEVRIGE